MKAIEFAIGEYIVVCLCVCMCMCVHMYVCVHMFCIIMSVFIHNNSHYHCHSYTLGKFREGMKNNNNIPRTVDQFEQVTETSTEAALKVPQSCMRILHCKFHV